MPLSLHLGVWYVVLLQIKGGFIWVAEKRPHHQVLILCQISHSHHHYSQSNIYQSIWHVPRFMNTIINTSSIMVIAANNTSLLPHRSKNRPQQIVGIFSFYTHGQYRLLERYRMSITRLIVVIGEKWPFSARSQTSHNFLNLAPYFPKTY